MYKRVMENLSVYFGITLGAIVMGAALSIFLVPFKVAPGGISGLATILYYITGIRVSTLILFINAPIFIVGFLNLGGSFLLRSVYGTIVLSVTTELFAYVPPLTEDIIIACVFGGAAMGFGIATVLKTGGSTGGMDIIVLLARRFVPGLSVGQLFLVLDGIIIVLAGAVFGNWEVIFYSTVAVFISSYVTDLILEGVNFARLVYIISDHTKEITDEIYKSIGRGVTGLSSVSMYRGTKNIILLCVIKKYELGRLKKLVGNIDNNAFLIISDAKEVMGNGFGEINKT